MHAHIIQTYTRLHMYALTYKKCVLIIYMYAYACKHVYLYACIIAYTYTQTQTHTAVEYLLGYFLQGTKLSNKTSQKVTPSLNNNKNKVKRLYHARGNILKSIF